MTDQKTFHVGKNWSGHDLNTFMGRLKYYGEVVSPTNSFKSAATIKQYNADANKLITERSDSSGNAKMTQQEFDEFRAKKIVLASSMSPDTGEVIPWVSRTCSFVPTNIPIIAGMLISPPSAFYTIMWQWINQTYNAALNFGNRNASSQQTTAEMA